MCWAVQKELEGHRPAMVPTRSHPILAMRAQCLCGAVTWSWCSVTLREELMGRISASSRFPPATIIQASEFLAPDWHSEELPPPHHPVLAAQAVPPPQDTSWAGCRLSTGSQSTGGGQPASASCFFHLFFFFYFTDTVVEIC